MKTVDRAVDLSERMKKALIRAADHAQNVTDDGQATPSEYAGDKLQYGMEDILTESGHIIVDAGKGAYRTGKSVIYKEHQNQDAAGLKINSIKTFQRTERTIKQSARTAELSINGTQKTVKTADQTSKVAIKSAQETAKSAQKAAQTAAKTAQKAVQITKVAAKTVAAAAKKAVAAAKELVTAIAAGGWVAVVIIIVIMLVALIVGSCFGIFFSGEDTGSTITTRSVVQEINMDYQSNLDAIRNATVYDKIESTGFRAVWPEVLAIYAVKVNTDPDNPQEVASMDDTRKAVLTEIFWAMNQIDSRVETAEETVLTEEVDEDGNIVVTETTETVTTLYITVTHKAADTMADEYGFSDEQKLMLNELLQDENATMWSAVLYGIYDPNEQIVAVAESQLGNVGGQPYWSWYGFTERVEWCACFVSWCANECGYIDMGVVPKFASCGRGIEWFQDRGQWADGTATPVPGMIIFFDWDAPDSEAGPQDGVADHVGIVQKVEDGYVYTIEGNSGDNCVQNSYSVRHYEIYGYGMPAY